ncbi:cupin domain-containing protein [Haloplanus halophilus]|uniref:cupin domain-containing protein n=1 Tax=Haloplanus halophilus TaxID=2949993 RepID=UPI00203EE121|nr:cupin domain-containing protein [Haloplanus sp. GDY1]
MPRVDFDAERDYDDEEFAANVAFRSDRAKVICAFFEPGQFIPVHAPGSDLVVTIRSGTGVVRDGDTDRRVDAGDVVVVPADTERGIRADEGSRLEALVVAAPPPTDAEHEPVRRGLRRGEFDPDRGSP